MKISNQITLTENRDAIDFELHVQKTSTILFVLLTIIGSVIIVMPVLVFIVGLIEKWNLGFGFIFTIVIAVLVSFYLFRLAFWNRYGVERFIVGGNRISIIADYKLYKDNVMKLEGSEIRIRSYDKKENQDKTTTAKLIFELNEKQFLSTIDLPITEINEIIEIIYTRLQS